MKRNFLRKVLSLTMAAAFVMTSIPGTALVADAAVNIDYVTLPEPVYEFNFEQNLNEKNSKTTAEEKTQGTGSQVGDYEGTAVYLWDEERNGYCLDTQGVYGLDLNIPSEGRTQDYTISFWANPQANLGWADSLINWGIRVTDGNDQWASLAGNGIWSAVNGVNNNMVGYTRVNNEWQQYTISVEGSTASIYRNGVLNCTQTVDEDAYTITDSTVLLAVNAWDNTADCLYDDVKIYHQALSAEEVRELYAVGDISLEAEYSNIRVGETLELNANIVDGREGDTVAFSSSDSSVAAVDKNGIVTGKEKGTATITASLMRNGLKVTEASYDVDVLPAEKGELIADFTFDDAEAGLTGAGAVARMENDNETLSFTADGDRNVLNFTGTTACENPNWLTVTKKDGTSLLAGVKEFTVSYDSNSRGVFMNTWTFFADQPSVAADDRHYIAIADYPTALTVERYNESVGTGDAYSSWKHIDVVFREYETRVYVDGILSGTIENTHSVEESLGNESLLYIGRATWANGTEYWSGMLDNYKIYNYARTDSEIKNGDPILVSGITINGAPEAMTVGDTAALTAAVAPVDAWNNAVTWSSSAPEVVSVDSNGAITAISTGTAAITATAADGSGVYASVDITVKEKTYTLTVNKGTIKDGKTEYTYGETAVITAEAPADGETFVGWKNTANKFVCYASTYTFPVYGDTELTAVYATEENPVEKEIVLSCSAEYKADMGKILFTAERVVPVALCKNGKLVEHGILLTGTAATGTNSDTFVIGGTNVTQSKAKTTFGCLGTYTVTLKGSSGRTYYARSYVKYIDAETDAEKLVYSDIIQITRP